MSNTNTNAVEYDVTVDDVSTDLLPEAESKANAPKKKNVASRIFAALLVALSVAAIFLPINVVVGTEIKEATLLTLILDVINGNTTETLFGVLPVFAATNSLLGKVAALSVYLLVLMLVLTVVTGIVTVFSGKGLRATAFFFAAGFVSYSACTTLALDMNSTALTFSVAFIVPMALAAVGMILYFVLAVIKNKGKAVVNTLQLLFTMDVTLEIVYALTVNPKVFNTALSDLGLASVSFIIKLVVLAVLFLNVVIGCIRMQTKKGLTLDLIRYIVQLILSGALCYMTLADEMVMLFAIVAAGISLLQIVICIIQLVCAKKKAKKAKAAEEVAPVEEVAEQAAPVVEEEYVQEEYVEAVPYDGGPVAGVEVAEEVTPCEPAPAPQVETAGYDFYNSRSFDAFIASLSNEERNQFTELFILKYKGVMPEIPDYQVGGDNKEFFRKIFIYLGQYRDRIPDGLLAKIYQFAVRM